MTEVDPWALRPYLRALVNHGGLPDRTLRVLHAVKILRTVPRWDGGRFMTPAEYRDFTRNLGAGTIPRGRLRERLIEVEEAGRELTEAGYTFDLDTGRVRRSGSPTTGGAPPYLLRELVEALLDAPRPPVRASRNSTELRTWISRELDPFLTPEEVDPRKGGPLDEAVRAAFRRFSG